MTIETHQLDITDGLNKTLYDKLKEENKRLQEQLNEANEIISIYRCYDDTECGKATEYCKKWKV